jgi:hypothetical protein
MGGIAVTGTATEDERLASARAGLFAVKALSATALDRLHIDDVPPSQVAAISEAAGALIDAVSPILSPPGEDHYVDQVVGIARSIHGA